MARKAVEKVNREGNPLYRDIPGARMKVRVTFLEELLGTANNNKDIHRDFIASKSPNPDTIEDEIASLGVDEVVEKSMTVFPRVDGKPFLYDYQWKGYFKDSCGMLKRASAFDSGKLKAYKKEIDGLIFIDERKIPIVFEGEVGDCQRPLRANTPQGERVSIAHSETTPVGATCEFTVICLKPDLMNLVREWLNYGVLHGTGQWRNSGKGRFVWEELDYWEVK